LSSSLSRAETVANPFRAVVTNPPRRRVSSSATLEVRAASTLRIACEGATGSMHTSTERSTLVCMSSGARNVAPTSIRGPCAIQYVAWTAEPDR